ncbi:MAG: hypothetical protein WCC11_11210 [Gammaproteobacteria bacterium]
MRIRHGLWVILIAALLGCASTGELANKPVQLQPGQGIAAIVLDAPNRITQIKYAAKDSNGGGFEVPDTQGGPSLYLVPIHAGRYCLQHFRYWQTIFDSVQDLGCFTAVAGKITYAGTIVPSPYLSGAQTDQQFNPAQFHAMLQQQYPVIAGMYAVASASEPPAGVQATPASNLISTWGENVPNRQAQAVYAQNNSSWSVEIVNLHLYDCSNIKRACGTSALHVTLGPFARKELLVVEPANTNAPYAYMYDFNYHNVD